MYIIIDNYDSFTYNLYQYLLELTDKPVKVFRNDETSIAELEALQPLGIVLSPGPGHPADAGITVDVIRHFAGKVPILGVCLGHQAIGQAFGATVSGAARIVHGKAERMHHDGRGLFRAVPNPAVFVRYHSLAIQEATMPQCLEVSCRAEDNEIMGVRHRTHAIEGVQFHPESAGSEAGKQLLRNFLSYRREPFAFRDTLGALMAGRDLSIEEAELFMEELTEGNLTQSQIAAILIAMAVKGPTGPEIAGCARVLQKKRVPVEAGPGLVDTCGTGGDGLGTFNISSFAALAASACGARVAKHGNRAVSSRSGSADFYGALGLPVDAGAEQASAMLRAHNFAFLFAPNYHSAMKHAAPVRRELAIKTIMNLLGPLSNPARAEYQVLGVYDGKLCRPMAEAARLLGVKRALVVHGTDGIDEISVSAPTVSAFLDENGSITERTIEPAEFGLSGFALTDVSGGSAQENAEAALDLARGGGRAALLAASAVNAGAALFVSGHSASLVEGYRMALKAIESGAVMEKIHSLRGAIV